MNAADKESKSTKLRASMTISGLGVSFDKYVNSIRVKVGGDRVES